MFFPVAVEGAQHGVPLRKRWPKVEGERHAFRWILDRLHEIDKMFGANLDAVFSTRHAIEEYVLQADVVIGAVLMALGHWDEFRMHLRAGLNNGLTKDEIKEIILQALKNSGYAIVQDLGEAMIFLFTKKISGKFADNPVRCDKGIAVHPGVIDYDEKTV